MKSSTDQLDSRMNNGWQAAVVDWDRAEAMYRERGDVDIADALSSRSKLVLKDGELCWIACVTVEDVILNKQKFKMKKAYTYGDMMRKSTLGSS